MSDAKFMKKLAAAQCCIALNAINNGANGEAVKPAPATCRHRAHTLASNDVGATVGGIAVHRAAGVLNPTATQGLNLPRGSNAWGLTAVGTRTPPPNTTRATTRTTTPTTSPLTRLTKRLPMLRVGGAMLLRITQDCIKPSLSQSCTESSEYTTMNNANRTVSVATTQAAPGLTRGVVRWLGAALKAATARPPASADLLQSPVSNASELFKDVSGPSAMTAGVHIEKAAMQLTAIDGAGRDETKRGGRMARRQAVGRDASAATDRPAKAATAATPVVACQIGLKPNQYGCNALLKKDQFSLPGHASAPTTFASLIAKTSCFARAATVCIAALLGAVVAVPALAQSVPGNGQPFSCNGSAIYQLNWGSDINPRIDSVETTLIGRTTSFPSKLVVNLWNQNPTYPDSFALSPNGQYGYIGQYNRAGILRYNAITGLLSPFSNELAYATSVDPTSGNIVILGVPNNVIKIITPAGLTIGTVSIPTINGLRGIKVDGAGNVYLFDFNGNVFKIDGPLPAGNYSRTAPLAFTTPTAQAMVFGTDGYLYLGVGDPEGGGRYVRANPNTGAQINDSLGSTAKPWDLASCGFPPTYTLKKDIGARVAATDQFNLVVTSDGTVASTATTTGAATGVQPIGTSGQAVPGTSYTFSETAAGTTVLSKYLATYSCVNTRNAAVLASGTGTSVTVVIPPNSGDTGASVVCTFTNTPAPTLSKAFIPNIIAPGGTTALTFTLANVAGNPARSGMDFTDTLPVGLRLAAVPTASQCGGAVAGTMGGNTIALTGGTLASGAANCTIVAQVTTVAAPTIAACPQANNTNGPTNISALANLGNGVTAQCLAVVGTTVPTITKAFSPSTVGLRGASTLTITLSNNNATAAALSATLTDTFPSGFVVASVPTASTTCTGAGTLTATAGAGFISLAPARSIPANGSCTITVNVLATASGSQTNTIGLGALQTSNGNNTTAASATLSVVNVPGNGQPFSCNGSTLYELDSGNKYQIQSIDGSLIGRATTFSATSVVNVWGQVQTDPETLAISPNGRYAYIAQFHQAAGILRYDAITGLVSPFSSEPVYALSVDPTTGNILILTASNPNFIKIITPAGATIGTVSLPYIDELRRISVDGAGNVYLMTRTAKVFKVDGPLPAGTYSRTPTLAFDILGWYGMTFSSDGYLYATGNDGIDYFYSRLNPNTGAFVDSSRTTDNSGGAWDLSSCGSAPSYTLKKDIVARVAATDQFNLVVTSNGTVVSTTTTTGAATGVQPIGTSGPALPGTSYTFSETGTGADAAARAAMLAKYLTTYSCVNTSNAAVLASGTGTSVTVAIPSNSGVSLVCTFTNTPMPPALTKVFSPTSIAAGGTTALTFTIANVAGNPARSGMAFTDTLPAGLRLAAVPTASQCGGAVAGTVGGNTIALTGGTLASGVASCTIVAQVTTVAAPTVAACPQANNTNGPTNISTLANLANGVTAQCLTVTAPVLTITSTKTASATPLVVGATGQYYDITVTVANASTSAALTIADTLPTGIALSDAPTVFSGTATLSGCPATGGTLAGCSVASGAPIGSFTIRVPVTVAAGAVGASGGTNIANLSGGGDSACTVTPGEACDSTTGAVAVVLGGPTLRIVKTVTSGSGSNLFNFALIGLSASSDSITVVGVASTNGSSTLTGLAGRAVTISETSPAGWPANPVSASCVDGNAPGSGNPTGPLGTLTGNVLSIPAANIRTSADLTCTFTNTFGFSITGRVFNDNGTSGGTANDGLINGGEAGTPGVGVKLTNCTGTTYATATTDAIGNYSLSVPFGTATGAQLCVEETNLGSSVSTGASAGSKALPSLVPTPAPDGTSYTYTRTGTPDRMAFTFNGTAHSGLNFGNVGLNTFVVDGVKSGQPGNTVSYAHTFTAQTGGSVSFGIASSVAAPAVSGWSEKIYADPLCTGSLQPGAALLFPPAVATAVVAGQQVCVIMQEFIPATALNGHVNTVKVQADFTFTNAAPALQASYQVTDVTTVGSGALELKKQVRNVTQNVLVFGLNNQAKSGETLEYLITYTNIGASPITSLTISDTTPTYTTFISALAGTTPASLSACQKNTPANALPVAAVVCTTAQTTGGTGAINFQFAGPLSPSGTGTVVFRVNVD